MTADRRKGTINGTPEWRLSADPVRYPEAVAAMEERVETIQVGRAPELIWCLEHPPIYTAGSSSPEEDYRQTSGLPVYATGRGGRMTYHGTGQRVVYVLTDLRQRGRDVRAHVARLETWIINVLAGFGVRGERREGRVGVWVVRPDGREEKIAAIGVRVRRWITYHGLSLNVSPDLQAFAGIVPCGLPEFGVTSLQALGKDVRMPEVDEAFRTHWARVFES